MKKLSLALALLLLLAGCTQQAVETSPPPPVVSTDTPATASPTFTPHPTATPKPEWWEKLMMDELPVKGGKSIALDGGTQVFCLEALTETDTSLSSPPWAGFSGT